MWKTGIMALVAALAIHGAAWAQDGTFVGFTTVVTRANTGTGTRQAMCDAEFPGSRMCNSADVLNVNPPVGEGWVQPSFVNGNANNAFDVSGNTSGTLNCYGWTSIGSASGLILRNDGSFSGLRVINCNSTYSTPLPVACCTVQAAEQTQTEVIWSRPGQTGQ